MYSCGIKTKYQGEEHDASGESSYATEGAFKGEDEAQGTRALRTCIDQANETLARQLMGESVY